MHSLRKLFSSFRPKKEDSSKLALFYWADEELTMVAAELDSFDGRTDPDRCSILVSQLRFCQDKVLSICNDIMDDAIPDMRANRDFRAKFPDDVLHENLAGQLWFGAECLAAGSNIIYRELESASMRPLAKALTRALENVRCFLREQSLKNSLVYSEKVREALRIFDRLFAEFELCYVSAMVPIKSAKEYHLQQEIIVLFSETMIRALKIGLVSQDMVDDYDPSLMFTIPRLAIVWGLLLYPDGPFNVEKESGDLSELFRPFCNLLFKIRDLLWTLTGSELLTLEKMLCSLEEPKIEEKLPDRTSLLCSSKEAAPQFYRTQATSKQFIQDFYTYNFGIAVPEGGAGPDKEAGHHSSPPEDEPDKMSGKCCRSGSIELDVELQRSAAAFAARKSPEGVSESDLDTLVSSDFTISDYDDIFAGGGGRCDSKPLPRGYVGKRTSGGGEKKRHEAPPPSSDGSDGSCSGQCTTSTTDCESDGDDKGRPGEEAKDGDTDDLPDGKGPDDVAAEPRLSPTPAACCEITVDDPPSEDTGAAAEQEEQDDPSAHSTSSLENRLDRLHGDCSCGKDESSREHLTPSREIMRQVMRRVEIVPPGQRIGGCYSSSVENSSPRAYHHGLLSRSFPTPRPESSPTPPGRRRTRRAAGRRRGARTPSAICDSEFPSPGLGSAASGLDVSAPSEKRTPVYSSPLTIPRVQHLRKAQDNISSYSSCSSCQSVSSVSGPEWDSTSPDTSSYNSECQDDEEIALALQAAEIASRNKARSRFKSSRDLLHKLFVCVSGVADQLQTNYASDLRNILKSVFDMNCCPSEGESPADGGGSKSVVADGVGGGALPTPTFTDLTDESEPQSPRTEGEDEEETEEGSGSSSVDSAEEVVPDPSPTQSLVIPSLGREDDAADQGVLGGGPPEWMPDELSSNCMACKVQFTILRRRHHCRNCGKIFCSRCSSNSIPLPRFGHLKPVRVCNQCFMYQLTNLVMQRQLFQ